MGNIPTRCPSCGSVIAVDEIEATGAAWAARQSFDDWCCVPDEVEHLRTATFIGLHPSFANGCLCPNCRYPFSSIDRVSPFGTEYQFDDDDPFSDSEVPF